MIYFIQQGKTGPIKIGYSNNVNERIKSLQSASPEKLVLLGYINGTRKQEQLIHRFFHKYQMEGEWFTPAPRVLNYIFSLIVGFDIKPTECNDLDGMLKELEKTFIKTALQRFNNNKTKAAESLNISFRSLRYRLEKLDI